MSEKKSRRGCEPTTINATVDLTADDVALQLLPAPVNTNCRTLRHPGGCDLRLIVITTPWTTIDALGTSAADAVRWLNALHKASRACGGRQRRAAWRSRFSSLPAACQRGLRRRWKERSERQERARERPVWPQSWTTQWAAHDTHTHPPTYRRGWKVYKQTIENPNPFTAVPWENRRGAGHDRFAHCPPRHGGDGDDTALALSAAMFAMFLHEDCDTKRRPEDEAERHWTPEEYNQRPLSPPPPPRCGRGNTRGCDRILWRTPGADNSRNRCRRCLQRAEKLARITVTRANRKRNEEQTLSAALAIIDNLPES